MSILKIVSSYLFSSYVIILHNFVLRFTHIHLYSVDLRMIIVIDYYILNNILGVIIMIAFERH
jgi:hypothetical protein